jgi:hypothetical protein
MLDDPLKAASSHPLACLLIDRRTGRQIMEHIAPMRPGSHHLPGAIVDLAQVIARWLAVSDNSVGYGVRVPARRH